MGNHYHLFSKIIHWSTALIIMGLLFLGFYMTTLDYSTDKLALYDLHKSFGLLILLLFVVRLAGYAVFPKPKPLETHKKWEKILSKSVHYLFYAVLIFLPMSGWVMSSAGEYAVKFFGLNVPAIVVKDERLFNNSRDVHQIFAFILLAALFLHIAGAYKHHFIDRDETLERMTKAPMKVYVLIFLTGAIALFYLPTLGLVMYDVSEDLIEDLTDDSQDDRDKDLKKRHKEKRETLKNKEKREERSDFIKDNVLDSNTKWTIDPEQSVVTFTAKQYGQDFEGSFEIAQAEIFFDPEKLEQSRVRILMDIASINTGSKDKDSQAVSADWFHATEYPHAIFESENFEQTKQGYVAKGTLTIRGNKRPLDLPFTLEFGKNDEGARTADMQANLSLNRLDYGVGQGQWAATDAIGGEIALDIYVSAIEQN
ncbi:MAG: hypothetical protein GC137_03605 [Alphaproteobacteria bacterium]|nr:hypothetical protein [Alphaproteobacteria bacterium]